MGLDVKHLDKQESVVLPAELSPGSNNLHRAGSSWRLLGLPCMGVASPGLWSLADTT